MVALLYRMNNGIPGDVNRFGVNATIEAGFINPAGSPVITAYGVPVAQDSSGGVRAIVAGDQASPPATLGIIVRPYPVNASTASGYFGQQLLGGGVSPPLVGTVDILKRGYITVLLSGTTAAVRGGQVFIWAAAASGSHILAGFEAGATGGSTFVLPFNTYFMGGADPSGNVEIGFNI